MPRVEGVEKVSGMTQYAADITVPGALWGKVLRSPLPHAILRRVDTSKARNMPGVHAVVCGSDLPPFLIGQRMKDMPEIGRASCRERV